MISRRDVLRFAGCSVLHGAWLTGQPPSGDAGSIRAAVGGTGMLVGITIGKSQIVDAVQAKFITDNFNMVTPGTAMKWAYIHPDRGGFSWSYADSIVSFARQHSLAVHGHNLCWNMFNPSWVQQAVNSTNARSILENHIHAVVSRYQGQIDTWDVVNEPVKISNGRPGGYMAGPWYDSLGPEYIDIAFHTAAAADPRAIRQLNMDNVEQDTDSCEATRQAELGLIRAALKRGVPMQAVGIESHIRAWLPVRSMAFVRFLKELMDLGLKVNITELDVDDTGVVTDLPHRLQIVSDYYTQYLEEVVPLTGTKRVNFWSLTDKNNWIDTQYPRADHQHHRPGLTSDHFTPNPAYYAIEHALGKLAHR